MGVEAVKCTATKRGWANVRIRNTSNYPDSEVRELVTFAMKGIDTTGVLVNVKNSKHSYRGMAYHGIPSMSPAARMSTVDRLITIGIGTPDRFPVDNMVTKLRWTPWQDADEPDPDGVGSSWAHASRWHYVGGRENVQQVRFGQPIRHPYGGKRSPHIEMVDWREALVAVAAHEARHHYQMAHRKPCSEVDAERHAAKVLARFRSR